MCCRDFLPSNAPGSPQPLQQPLSVLSKTCSKLGAVIAESLSATVFTVSLTSSRASDANFSLITADSSAPLLFCISAEGLINFRNSNTGFWGHEKQHASDKNLVKNGKGSGVGNVPQKYNSVCRHKGNTAGNLRKPSENSRHETAEGKTQRGICFAF